MEELDKIFGMGAERVGLPLDIASLLCHAELVSASSPFHYEIPDQIRNDNLTLSC